MFFISLFFARYSILLLFVPEYNVNNSNRFELAYNGTIKRKQHVFLYHVSANVIDSPIYSFFLLFFSLNSNCQATETKKLFV